MDRQNGQKLSKISQIDKDVRICMKCLKMSCSNQRCVPTNILSYVPKSKVTHSVTEWVTISPIELSSDKKASCSGLGV